MRSARWRDFSIGYFGSSITSSRTPLYSAALPSSDCQFNSLTGTRQCLHFQQPHANTTTSSSKRRTVGSIYLFLEARTHFQKPWQTSPHISFVRIKSLAYPSTNQRWGEWNHNDCLGLLRIYPSDMVEGCWHLKKSAISQQGGRKWPLDGLSLSLHRLQISMYRLFFPFLFDILDGKTMFSTAILLSLSFYITLFPFAQAMGLHLHCFSLTKQCPKTFSCPQNVSLFKAKFILSLSLTVTIPTGPFYSLVLILRVLLALYLFKVRAHCRATYIVPVWLKSLLSPLFLLTEISSDCNATMSFLRAFCLPLQGHWLLDQTYL